MTVSELAALTGRGGRLSVEPWPDVCCLPVQVVDAKQAYGRTMLRIVAAGIQTPAVWVNADRVQLDTEE